MYASSNLAVAVSAFAITKSDTVNFTRRARYIYVGGAGNVAVQTLDGASVVFTAVPVGTILPIECLRVNATLTTATALVGLA